ncbi:MAG: T9SS type A sorting domain-containing protein, partial [Phaeodactylibacter sp.]|nr:T9SS type A sorting domain-containing protein [Phaeodactylibacter sp.]
DYVDYLSGSYIPTSNADYIIGQINTMIDAIDAGTAECCGENRPANPGQGTVMETLELEASPNPFREEVSISFYLPEAGPATLEAFNLNGQQVAALHSGYLDAGFQRFSWNGAGEGGQRLSGGVYLIRLQAESGTLTQKVSLMR